MRRSAPMLLMLAVAFTPLQAHAGTTTTVDDGVQIIVTSPDRASAAPSPAKRARARGAANVRPATTRPQPPATAAGTNLADELIGDAMALQGRPYVFGGTTPSGFDCSGYTQYVFARVGVRIPRTADAQFAAGRPVADPRPGDLLFFQTYDYGASHVAIYLGGGTFVNAIGTDVHVADFSSPYFRGRYLGARRFLPG